MKKIKYYEGPTDTDDRTLEELERDIQEEEERCKSLTEWEPID